MTRPLIASDLDRTLIYSRAFLEAASHVVAVERYRDADASFMTVAAGHVWADLHCSAVVVPTTTRTTAQLRRVRLPGPPPRHAVACNGGVLLVDGEPDAGWTRTVETALTQVMPAREMHRHARDACHGAAMNEPRTAEGLFCYTVNDAASVPAGFVEQESTWAAERGWRVSVQGRKIYWVPRTLTKSAAIAEVARREGTELLLAAGDSLLDADLLEAADAGIAARHGELVASGWNAQHVDVTAACGLAAGEEIVHWFAGWLTSRATP